MGGKTLTGHERLDRWARLYDAVAGRPQSAVAGFRFDRVHASVGDVGGRLLSLKAAIREDVWLLVLAQAAQELPGHEDSTGLDDEARRLKLLRAMGVGDARESMP